MVGKLGAGGFMNELCNGFRLLMDGGDGVSLKKNSAVLGLQDMSNDEEISWERRQIKKEAKQEDSDSSLDDYVYHMICPCCSLCQESRTL
ncbi:hypothetical protein F0562_014174 [Nyssa sinensis]|uniref:Uncharacterized protein n=1 Tax=Nyssa sinensis TaxID=561372 RepID=A0A5J4ZQD2_9ASTE|nr:hypothetical protein F0562_014174 [Nyssa sinensis]